MAKIKLDSKNYRVHSDKNKMIIDKSLKELGAGRSILIDSENEIIAGNGVFEQAEKQNIKMLNLLEMHSQDIKSLKKDVNVLEHRVSRLEDSQVNIYNRLGGKENDNT